MKPLVVNIVYTDDYKEKALEIYTTIKQNYRLYHEYNTTLTTPMFTVYLTKNMPLAQKPDIFIIPDNFHLTKPIENTVTIYYSSKEIIQLWEL